MDKKTFAAIAAFTLIPSMASAAYLDGNILYEQCSVNRSVVIGYSASIVDYAEMIYTANQSTTKAFCIPAEVRTTQIADIVCQSLTLNPSTRQQVASVLVHNAIAKLYPCQ